MHRPIVIIRLYKNPNKPEVPLPPGKQLVCFRYEKEPQLSFSVFPHTFSNRDERECCLYSFVYQQKTQTNPKEAN